MSVVQPPSPKKRELDNDVLVLPPAKKNSISTFDKWMIRLYAKLDEDSIDDLVEELKDELDSLVEEDGFKYYFGIPILKGPRTYWKIYMTTESKMTEEVAQRFWNGEAVIQASVSGLPTEPSHWIKRSKRVHDIYFEKEE